MKQFIILEIGEVGAVLEQGAGAEILTEAMAAMVCQVPQGKVDLHFPALAFIHTITGVRGKFVEEDQAIAEKLPYVSGDFRDPGMVAAACACCAMAFLEDIH